MIQPAAIPREDLIASHRREILLAVAAARSVPGTSQNQACAAVGIDVATYIRWKRAHDQGGIEALRPRHKQSGRRPEALLTEEEKHAVQKLYIQMESATTALRQFAHDPRCRQEVADVILKSRTSKHTLTKTLRRQVRMADTIVRYHKSPKDVRVNGFINPRTLTYIDVDGAEKPIRPGDLFERDDMSNNFIVWVDWPWGGDPCSDKYGVRIARGQNLLQIDVGSLYFQSFCFLIRLRDSYRADDIWQWMADSYQDVGLPRIGERLERGTWQSHKIAGQPVEAGHTTAEIRLGGLQALGLRLIVAQSPTTKIIENRFNYLQTVCSTIRGQIGRDRGEMEKTTKLWMECRAGRKDPRDYFLSYEQAVREIEAKLHFVNSEPVEGNLYHGIPAARYQEVITADPLRKLAPQDAYLFARDRALTTVSKCAAMVRYTNPDGKRGAWWFRHADLWQVDGRRVAVYYDKHHVSAGATLVLAEGEKAGTVIGHADLIEGVPQFALGFQEDGARGARAAMDGLDQKNAFMSAVRAEYRALGMDGVRLARSSRVSNGAGAEASIRHRAASVEVEEPLRPAPRPAPRRTEIDPEAQLDRISRLEREAAARGEIFSP